MAVLGEEIDLLTDSVSPVPIIQTIIIKNVTLNMPYPDKRTTMYKIDKSASKTCANIPSAEGETPDID